MGPQADSPRRTTNANKNRPVDPLFIIIPILYRRSRGLTVTAASEEHRETEVTFKIVRRLFFAQQIDIEQVIPEIEMQRDRVCQ